MLVTSPVLLMYFVLVMSAVIQFQSLSKVIDMSANDTESSGINSTVESGAHNEVSSGDEKYILLYSRSNPEGWKWGLGIVYSIFFFMEFAHYTLASFVDNSPGCNPPRTSVIDDTIVPGEETQEEDSTIVDIAPLNPEDDEHGKEGPQWPKIRLSKIKRCPKCGALKPDRCHHCSTCGKCCIKFDHHCLQQSLTYVRPLMTISCLFVCLCLHTGPFFGNCIGFYNYKFFLCFLIWSVWVCLFLMIESIPVLIWMIHGNFCIDALLVLFIGFFCFSMIGGAGVMLGIHIPLALTNMTTFESPGSMLCGDVDFHSETFAYDNGWMNNLKQIFGNNYLLWFLPVPTYLGDGYAYPEGKQGKQP